MRFRMLLITALVTISCRNISPSEASLPKKPLTRENLQGSWTTKPGSSAEIRFSQDSIFFIEDEQAFPYMITGDSIQFEFEYATFWYRIDLLGEEQMRMSSPHMAISYSRIKQQ